MKTFTKVVICSLAISALLLYLRNVNIILSFIVQMILFGSFILLISIVCAIRMESAPEPVINKYDARIKKYRQALHQNE